MASKRKTAAERKRSDSAKKSAATRKRNQAKRDAAAKAEATRETPASQPETTTPNLRSRISGWFDAHQNRKPAMLFVGALLIIGALVALGTVVLDNDNDGGLIEDAVAQEDQNPSAGDATGEDSSSEGGATSNDFDMESCLKEKVKVPVGPKDDRIVSKTEVFCEAQSQLSNRSVAEDLHGMKAVNHHGQDGAVSYKGVLGLDETEELTAFYRDALQDPYVAAQILDCWTKQSLDDQTIAEYRGAEQGSSKHLEAVRLVHALLTHPKFSLDDIELFGTFWNEGAAPGDVPTATETTHNGTPAVQVSVPTFVTDDGTPITGGKAVQLKRCVNCQTPTVPTGAVPTPKPGFIPTPPPGSPPGTPPGTPPADEMHPPLGSGTGGDAYEEDDSADVDAPAVDDSPQDSPVDPTNPSPSDPGGIGGAPGNQGGVGEGGTGQPGTGTIGSSNTNGETSTGGGASNNNPGEVTGGTAETPGDW